MFEELAVSQNYSETERRNQLKRKVLNSMEQDLDTMDGKIILYHDSDPVLYNEGGTWTLDSQTTIEQTDGTMKTETTLDIPLGATPLLSANILLPEGLCKASFVDSKRELCCRSACCIDEVTLGLH